VRPRAALLFGAAVLAAGCGGDEDVQAAREFERFPLYWVGESFEGFDLVHVDGLEHPAQFVTFVYGECTPTGGDEPSCVPPFQIQVFPLCWHLDAVAEAPVWRRRRIRGAPVGTDDSAPVLFSRGAQVKVYRGADAKPGIAFRALSALRSVNRVAPIVAAGEPIPAPAPGVLAGSRPCKA
jgi:hypothetical protein